jgi:MFS family permease
MITVIGQFVPPERRSAAQGLLGGIVFGVGGMAGSAVSGYLFDAGGGSLVFYGCAAAEAIALVLFAIWWFATGRSHFRREPT